MQVDRGGSDAAGYVQQPTHRKTPTATPQVPTTKVQLAA